MFARVLALKQSWLKNLDISWQSYSLVFSIKRKNNNVKILIGRYWYNLLMWEQKKIVIKHALYLFF